VNPHPCALKYVYDKFTRQMNLLKIYFKKIAAKIFHIIKKAKTGKNYTARNANKPKLLKNELRRKSTLVVPGKMSLLSGTTCICNLTKPYLT